MEYSVNQDAEKYSKDHRRKKRWYSIVICLSAVVVFCTIYAMILPAISMEKCQILEHTHSETCYSKVSSITKMEPVCTIDSLTLHKHTEDCFDETGKIICGYADFIVHHHNASCYDETGTLWCPLPEIEAHTHSESCFAVPEESETESISPSDPHTDSFCTETASLEYTEEDDSLQNDVNDCETETESKRIEAEMTADDCVNPSEETDESDESDESEPAASAEKELICGKEEVILHTHTPDCLDENGNLICGKIQILEHIHSETCFQTVEVPIDGEALTCQLEENESHRHSALCYGTWELTCPLQEHIHTQSCMAVTTDKEDDQQITKDMLLDISDGPAVFIFSSVFTQETNEETEQTDSSEFNAETPVQYSLKSRKAVTDLISYIENNGGNFFFTLVDTENKELPKDDTGSYIVFADTEYKLTLTLTSPNGFAAGTYQYQLPAGLTVNGGTGTFILDGTEVGTWSVDSDGLITFVFNENANKHTEVTISATMGVTFSESENPIDFDGKITVTVQKPPEEEKNTELSKWGSQGDADEGEDPNKIYWTIEILGYEDSSIPGNIITDAITSGNHTYTESDMANGLTFMASQTDPVTGEEIEGGWHKWYVQADDPNLN